jgi:hypothetical protein
MNTISLKKQVYEKRQFTNVIDTEFSQLVTPTSSVAPPTVDEFFNLYESLFFSIPKFGISNSHEYIIKQSSEYINFQQTNEDIQALIEEINSLRNELLTANQTIISLQNQTPSGT